MGSCARSGAEPRLNPVSFLDLTHLSRVTNHSRDGVDLEVSRTGPGDGQLVPTRSLQSWRARGGVQNESERLARIPSLKIFDLLMRSRSFDDLQIAFANLLNS
jgi:hypothetical protein